jgi:hypothetical protein
MTEWHPDAVRDDLSACANNQVGGPGGTLIIDATGFPNEGGA